MAVSQTGEKHGQSVGVLRLMFQPLQFVRRPYHLGMVVRITQRFQGNQGIEHRRKNGRQPVRTFKPFQHPLFALSQARVSERDEYCVRKPFGNFVQLIQPQEKIPRGESFRIRRQGQFPFMNTGRI